MKLIEPTIALETEYKEMLEEWKNAKDEPIPFILQYDATDFQKFIFLMDEFKKGTNLPPTFVPQSTFWLIGNTDRILGIINIRHDLTDRLRLEGGHIGYGIRPSERRKGFATLMLSLALKEAQKLGITRTLLTCDKSNTGSIRTILNNHGKLEKEIEVKGTKKLHFWIDFATNI